jgi:hypothetical protein
VTLDPMAVVTRLRDHDNTRCAARDLCALEKGKSKAFGCELLADSV